ncbi:MAG: uroporphyrinogen decarboxylase family protein [Planctomycetota bacterium]
MARKTTKRERLLGWMREGDPETVPVMMADGPYTAAAFLGKNPGEVSVAEVIRVAEDTGTHDIVCLHMPLPFDALPFIDEIEMRSAREVLADGTVRETTHLCTPVGTMRKVWERPPGKPQRYREFFVKGKDDLPALRCFIERTAEAFRSNDAVRRRLVDTMHRRKDEVAGALPTLVHMLPGAVELMDIFYIDQTSALYLVYDERALMEELMELHWEMEQVWLECAAEVDVDFYQYAINGFEWLSPDLYERYMIPQARRINEFASAHGKLSWIHTCGKMRKIAATGAYERMRVDVVESLSAPPTGDITDLAGTRREIGRRIVTRGGVNVEFFYADDLAPLRERAQAVLEATRGFRHMLGDTNNSMPPYRWETIEALVEVVRRTGKLLE